MPECYLGDCLCGHIRFEATAPAEKPPALAVYISTKEINVVP